MTDTAACTLRRWHHGLPADDVTTREEEPAAFEDLRAGLRDALAPMDANEETLVDRIAVAEWKRRRYEAAEAELFDAILDPADVDDAGPDESELLVWAREIGLDKALAQVSRMRKSADQEFHRNQSLLERARRRRERNAKEAAEAEAVVRVAAGASGGLTVKQTTQVLLVAWRDTCRATAGLPTATPRLTGLADAPTDAWLSPHALRAAITAVARAASDAVDPADDYHSDDDFDSDDDYDDYDADGGHGGVDPPDVDFDKPFIERFAPLIAPRASGRSSTASGTRRAASPAGSGSSAGGALASGGEPQRE